MISAHVLCALVFVAGLAISSGSITVRGQSPIINIISAGGSDIEDPRLPGSGPGFDKNYSLIAIKFADGTASGRLIDRYAGGGGLGLKGLLTAFTSSGTPRG